MDRKTVRTLKDIIKLNGNRSPAFKTGSRMDYSNYRFILLGAIIEKVIGQDFYDNVTKPILEPVGMSKSSWPAVAELKNTAIP